MQNQDGNGRVFLARSDWRGYLVKAIRGVRFVVHEIRDGRLVQHVDRAVQKIRVQQKLVVHLLIDCFCHSQLLLPLVESPEYESLANLTHFLKNIAGGGLYGMVPSSVVANEISHYAANASIYSTAFLQDLYYLLHTMTSVSAFALQHRDTKNCGRFVGGETESKKMDQEVIELHVNAMSFLVVRFILAALSYSLFGCSYINDETVSSAAPWANFVLMASTGIGQAFFSYYLTQKNNQYVVNHILVAPERVAGGEQGGVDELGADSFSPLPGGGDDGAGVEPPTPPAEVVTTPDDNNLTPENDLAGMDDGAGVETQTPPVGAEGGENTGDEALDSALHEDREGVAEVLVTPADNNLPLENDLAEVDDGAGVGPQTAPAGVLVNDEGETRGDVPDSAPVLHEGREGAAEVGVTPADNNSPLENDLAEVNNGAGVEPQTPPADALVNDEGENAEDEVPGLDLDDQAMGENSAGQLNSEIEETSKDILSELAGLRRSFSDGHISSRVVLPAPWRDGLFRDNASREREENTLAITDGDDEGDQQTILSDANIARYILRTDAEREKQLKARRAEILDEIRVCEQRIDAYKNLTKSGLSGLSAAPGKAMLAVDQQTGPALQEVSVEEEHKDASLPIGTLEIELTSKRAILAEVERELHMLARAYLMQNKGDCVLSRLDVVNGLQQLFTVTDPVPFVLQDADNTAELILAKAFERAQEGVVLVPVEIAPAGALGAHLSALILVAIGDTVQAFYFDPCYCTKAPKYLSDSIKVSFEEIEISLTIGYFSDLMVIGLGNYVNKVCPIHSNLSDDNRQGYLDGLLAYLDNADLIALAEQCRAAAQDRMQKIATAQPEDVAELESGAEPGLGAIMN
ncbi:MAG: hypothetical protein KAS93_06200 [Gammaproteobacteria bacterium]|nr:hypothetical protein [Gammaproteobacteria bacterium]